jgi:hypothetical protein
MGQTHLNPNMLVTECSTTRECVFAAIIEVSACVYNVFLFACSL